MKIEESNRKDKRFVATFDNGKKVHFGLKNAYTYLDGAPEEKRKGYLARHKVLEDWRDPYKAGTLSRYILWEFRSFNSALKAYEQKFNV